LFSLYHFQAKADAMPQTGKDYYHNATNLSLTAYDYSSQAIRA
jgi:hypothetical protein